LGKSGMLEKKNMTPIHKITGNQAETFLSINDILHL